MFVCMVTSTQNCCSIGVNFHSSSLLFKKTPHCTHTLSKCKLSDQRRLGLKQPAYIFLAPLSLRGQIRWGLEPTGPAGCRIHP